MTVESSAVSSRENCCLPDFSSFTVLFLARSFAIIYLRDMSFESAGALLPRPLRDMSLISFLLFLTISASGKRMTLSDLNMK